MAFWQQTQQGRQKTQQQAGGNASGSAGGRSGGGGGSGPPQGSLSGYNPNPDPDAGRSGTRQESQDKYKGAVGAGASLNKAQSSLSHGSNPLNNAPPAAPPPAAAGAPNPQDMWQSILDDYNQSWGAQETLATQQGAVARRRGAEMDPRFADGGGGSIQASGLAEGDVRARMAMQGARTDHDRRGLELKMTQLNQLMNSDEAQKNRDLQEKLQAMMQETQLALAGGDMPINPSGGGQPAPAAGSGGASGSSLAPPPPPPPPPSASAPPTGQSNTNLDDPNKNYYGQPISRGNI